MRIFRETEQAIFLARPNRFTLVCDLSGQIVKAFLPNPGRLWELLLPGATVYLERAGGKTVKMPYTAVAIQKDNHPVMVHTHRTNDLANYLIAEELIPDLEGTTVARREVKKGHSRFDFLLSQNREEFILEVKSCTLFSKNVAMFPDAITVRGKRHLIELANLSEKGIPAGVLFLIFSFQPDFFMPDYHTDLEFARTLLAVRNMITIIPLAVELEEGLSLNSKVKVLAIPWNIIEKEAEDRGSYLVILKLPEGANRKIGRLGELRFREGFYVYVGSAKRNLSQRILRHRVVKKELFWHIDYLREIAEFQLALPIRTADNIECEVSRALSAIADWQVPDFGSSDCSCPAHLYGMAEHPLKSPEFISFLQFFRMDRLIKTDDCRVGLETQ